MEHALKITGLKKRYGHKMALDGLNMNVPKNTVYGFLGENGAGKTTTFSILGGFLSSTEGAFEMTGKMGMLPQDAQFSHGRKIGSQLRFLGRLAGVPSAELDAEVKRVLKAVKMEAHEKLPVHKCSHGMYKRVGIAQALLGSPDLILLDEPTAGLDPKTAFEIRKLITDLNHQKTIVISSHNLAEIEEMCDQVGIINQGKMVFEGPVSELMGQSSNLNLELSQKPDIEAIKVIDGIIEATWNEKKQQCQLRFDRQNHSIEHINAVVLDHLLKNNIGIRSLGLESSLESQYLKQLALH